jgi:hypothetical protein
MNIWDSFKTLGLKVLLPLAVQQGEQSLDEYLRELQKKQPKRVAVMLQSLYPAFKGVLQPLCKSTKTPFDDMAVDPTVEELETLMTDLKIPFPEVTPIDFEAPEDLP